MTRIEAIKKRLEAATPGPWTTDYDKDGCLIDNEGFRLALTNDRDYAYFDSTPPQAKENAQLIAHAPADLAWCLSKLAEAEKVLEEIASLIPQSDTPPTVILLGHARALAEMALTRLRADESGEGK